MLIEFKTWIVATLFVILYSAEHIWPAALYQGNLRKRILKNMLFWPINLILSFLIIIPTSLFAAQHHIWLRPTWLTMPFSAILDIFLLDLFLYWWHRTVHENQFLWRFHEIHHLDEHLDTTSAVRFHFGEIFFATLVRALLILSFAIPFSSVILFETLVLIFTVFHHSNVKIPEQIERIIAKITVTPSIHWVHHHAIRQDTDSNYSTIFSFWDRLFNTKAETTRFENMRIGVEGKRDRSWLSLIKSPFLTKKDNIEPALPTKNIQTRT